MSTPETKLDAYRAVREAGEDVTLRYRVAAAIAEQPRTTHELAEAFPEKSANAIRPRVNELVRMRCVEREGKRTNPSGHDAYVHRITDLGERYLAHEVSPTPVPPLTEYQQQVVAMARMFVNGEADKDFLRMAIQNHDEVKQRMDPEWSPPGGER